ncbi:MAG: DNA polymerase III subunit delta' [Deltaproteobacteria bacterium]|nr:DNA polymerase III subunit delta' [Deltaproteobacteria bacterium]
MAAKKVQPDQKAPALRHILGQERAINYLKTALNAGRLAHAYLFLGPEGVGKATTAKALAAALNCEAPQADGDACGVCPSCVRLAAGTHPDYLEIRPTSKERPPKIVIDQVREFRKLTAYPPAAGGWRVTLIKPAEDMKVEAVNALLKTLEEPPPQHLLVLTARVEDDLFPTIVSRCQKLAFAPLPAALVAQELVRQKGLPQPEAALLAALCGGSLGRALALDPAELIRRRDQVLADLQQISGNGLSAILDWAQRLAKNVDEADNFLLMAQLWYRDLLLLHAGGPAALLAHQDRMAELTSAARRSGPEACFDCFAALGAAQRHLGANLNPELTLDILGLRLQQS